ncbi:GIY-YIG nuclease family protein [Flectobacillus roseus]|uniref:GIY-YIG nuclease family protein n=1 Tax=Flectobacillus roseus TaxID=502259 RepID=A0ABT6Y338_9BACT|nr:GIY-YIG nuclease family protein [Flectobacillus roseus]MDI9857970.1 GIY-YIG nuclease family protein [Flectobacillus roseus]
MRKSTNFKTGVYLIYAPNQNKIKIGRSVNIENRYKHLSTGFMDEGSLLIGILTKSEIELENTLHQKFSHLRANGEWFYLTKELDDFILNCNLEYPNVIIYEDLKVIQTKLSYQSLGVFNLIRKIKYLHNKYLIPSIVGFIGFIIAWYGYKYETIRPNTTHFHQILVYSNLILFPFITILISRLIITYFSIRKVVGFFSLLIIALFLEIINRFLHVEHNFLKMFRVVIVSIYLSWVTQILVWIYYKKKEEKDENLLRHKAKIVFKHDISLAIKYRDEIVIKIKKINKVKKYLILSSTCMHYVYLNIYFTFLAECSFNVRIFIVIFLNICLTVFLFIFQTQKISKKEFLLIRYIKFIIVPSILFIDLILFKHHLNEIHIHFNLILIIYFFSVMLVSFFTETKLKEYRMQLSEIDKHI